jgi:hypothetical protein
MEPTSSSPGPDTPGAAPVERRSILLRGYVESEPAAERDGGRWRQQPSEYALFFDTETNDDAAQQLRFGCYQLWHGEERRQRGIFYDPGNVKPGELAALVH